MKEMTWTKTAWCGNGAEFTLTPAGSVTVTRYESLSGLTGEQRVITPAWTSAGEYRHIWRYFRDAAYAAWREGTAWYADPVAKSQHPVSWDASVVDSARVITRQDLEKVLHHDEQVRCSKPVSSWFAFWAWITRPASHPRAWPVTAVVPDFAGKLLAYQSTGQFYELPSSWGKVFPLRSGVSLYWDGDEDFVLIARNCPDEVLGSLLSPDIAAKRRRWEL